MAKLSFTNTVFEYIEGCKTCTRRVWTPKAMEMWQRHWDKGNLIHDAYAQGEFIGKFKLTCRPYWEKLVDMPEADVVAEGGFCKTVNEFIKMWGKTRNDTVAVLRFEKVS